MAVTAGPKIVDDGLVFQIDQDNTVRSWKGKPTTNLVDPDFRNWSSITANVSLYKNYSNITRDAIYKLEDDNAAGYEYVQNDLTIPNDSTTYTISVYILKNHPDFDRQSEIAFNTKCTGGTQVSVFPRIETDSWTANVGTIEHIGEYVRFSHQITNNSSGNTTLTFPLFPTSGPNGGSDNNSNTGAIFVSGIQVEANDFATPFVDGTRSNTQSIIDIIGNRTITATSLTYNSDNTFSFDGSANYFDTTEVTHDDPNIFSISCWLKLDTIPTDTNVGHPVFFNYSSSQGWFLSIAGTLGKVQLRHHNGSSTAYNLKSSTNLSTDEWYHITATDDDSTVKIYINGVLDASTSSATAVLRSGHSPRIGNFGSFYFDGDISQMKIYNKALTADEVVTNFEASRDRYGV